MTQLMTEMNAQMALLSQPVQIWVDWMLGVFLVSIVFAIRHKAARIVFLAFLLTMPVGFGVFYLWGNVHLLGLAHFVVWGPLLVYLYRTEFKSGQVSFKTPYGIWLSLLTATILISLVFDVRDVVLVMMGQK